MKPNEFKNLAAQLIADDLTIVLNKVDAATQQTIDYYIWLLNKADNAEEFLTITNDTEKFIATTRNNFFENMQVMHTPIFNKLKRNLKQHHIFLDANIILNAASFQIIFEALSKLMIDWCNEKLNKFKQELESSVEVKDFVTNAIDETYSTNTPAETLATCAPYQESALTPPATLTNNTTVNTNHPFFALDKTNEQPLLKAKENDFRCSF